MSQEVDFLYVEFALFEFGVQAMFEEFLEDFAHVFGVFRKGVGVDQDVIEVCNSEVIQVFAYSVVDIGLKRGWGVR